MTVMASAEQKYPISEEMHSRQLRMAEFFGYLGKFKGMVRCGIGEIISIILSGLGNLRRLISMIETQIVKAQAHSDYLSYSLF